MRLSLPILRRCFRRYRLAELVARMLLLLLLSVWDVRLLLAVAVFDLAGLAALSNGRIQELGL